MTRSATLNHPITIDTLRAKDIVIATLGKEHMVVRGTALLHDIVDTKRPRETDIAFVPVSCWEEAEALKRVLEPLH